MGHDGSKHRYNININYFYDKFWEKKKIIIRISKWLCKVKFFLTSHSSINLERNKKCIEGSKNFDKIFKNNGNQGILINYSTHQISIGSCWYGDSW